MRGAVLAALAAATVLSSCGIPGRLGFGQGAGVTARSLPFHARLSSEGGRDFVVAVRAGGASVEQVRESARYYATRHCLLTWGRSDALWVTDPATGDWAARRDGDRLFLRGRCTGR